MTWQFILFITVLANSLSMLLGKFVLNDEKCDSKSFSIVLQGITGLLVLFFALLTKEINFDTNSIIWLLLLSPFLYLIVNLLRSRGLQLIESSEFMVLFSTGTIWSMVLATIFLNEKVNAVQFLGAILIIISVVLVSRFDFKSFRLKEGEILVLLSALGLAIAFTIDAKILIHVDASIYAAYAFLAPAILTIILYPKSAKNSLKLLNKRNLLPMLSANLMLAVAVIGIYRAYQLGRNAAVIVPINQTSTIIVVIFGIIFLKERNNIPRKIFAAVISMIGVILISV